MNSEQNNWLLRNKSTKAAKQTKSLLIHGHSNLVEMIYYYWRNGFTSHFYSRWNSMTFFQLYSEHWTSPKWSRTFIEFNEFDSVNIGKNSQLGKHGFGSLHNLKWTCYLNEDILLRHWLRFTNEVVQISLNSLLRQRTQRVWEITEA